jgi:hypothetical protein
MGDTRYRLLMTDRLGRAFFALTAVVVAVGIVVQLFAADTEGGRFTGAAALLNVFAFFTIQSNLLLAIVCAMLAVRLDRPSTVFRALRLSAVLTMAVVGIVFHIALAPLYEFIGLAAVANVLLHTVTPLMAVLGWLVFGPRGQTDVRVVAGTVVYPLLWLVFTLVRGPLAGDFYPYPFLDVGEHGYPRVLLNALLVAVLFLGLAAGAHALDRFLTRRRATVGVS